MGDRVIVVTVPVEDGTLTGYVTNDDGISSDRSLARVFATRAALTAAMRRIGARHSAVVQIPSDDQSP